jgi:hypothetical protein
MDQNTRMAIAGFEVVELPGGKGKIRRQDTYSPELARPGPKAVS